ncbi:MAG TPA: cysteine--tRNA ligase [Ktedonobacterales bacterium]|nr:cysteine--tRNA ligase [Ktedonobacterales bacterium]
MRLFNTLTQTVEPLRPHGDEVTLYVCGITPYDTTHLGHAFFNVVYDTLRRHLEWRGQPVRYVQNVTDIDDDILRKARELGATWDELGKRETQRYVTDLTALNVRPPTRYVRASNATKRMFALIETLLAKGLAYERDGWVYYDVSADPSFGKLADAAGYEGYDAWLATANERGNYPDDARKSDPLDFVMWQAQQPGEPAWESPWGMGRPGWHIECSAMATEHLGARIDIHGGGSDLIFPHHTCEIAQSENATDERPFSQVWMHCGMVGLDGEKMSKSLGNLILAADLLKKYTPDAIRTLLLSSHYRTPWEYFTSLMETAAERVARYTTAAHAASPSAGAESVEGDETARCAIQEFAAALDDDLDTPRALTILDRLATATMDAPSPTRVAALRQLGGVLGFRLGGANPPAPAWVSAYQ